MFESYSRPDGIVSGEYMNKILKTLKFIWNFIQETKSVWLLLLILKLDSLNPILYTHT